MRIFEKWENDTVKDLKQYIIDHTLDTRSLLADNFILSVLYDDSKEVIGCYDLDKLCKKMLDSIEFNSGDYEIDEGESYGCQYEILSLDDDGNISRPVINEYVLDTKVQEIYETYLLNFSH